MRVDPDGTASVAAEDLMFPNGSVIAPDGSTLIVGETAGCRYRGRRCHPNRRRHVTPSSGDGSLREHGAAGRLVESVAERA
jgi:sugar lactone lactonase YvrE